MELINNMDLDNTLIICPDSFKKTILKSLSEDKKLYNVKFMSIDEYRRNWFFDYDLKSVKYLVDKYGFSINNAKEIINNLYYVDDKDYEDDKLNGLVRYKKELEENGLLIYNPLFIKQIENRKVIVLGYGRLSKEDKRVINGEVIEYELKEKDYEIYRFEDIEEEIDYLYRSVADLIYENNIDINNIYVLGVNSDYESYIKRFNNYYPFEIETNDSEYIGGTKIGKKFVEMLEKNSKEEIYEYLNKEECTQLIGILNRYPEYKISEIKDFIINDINNTRINKKNKINVVKCVDFFTRFDDNDYVFLLGFNDKILGLKNDTDYISDRLKKKLDLSVSEEENEIIKSNALAYLSGINNLYISYCKESPFKKYNDNNLISNYRYINSSKSYDYSDKYNQIRYAYMLDSRERYGVEDDDLSLLYKEYGKNDFGTYDNRFKGLNDNQIKDIDKVSLSYSSMEEFYKCQFNYYLKYILGLNNYEDTFATKLGSFVHEVMKEYYQNKSFDFDESWNRNIEKYAPDNNSEAFFMNRIKDEIRKDIEIIKKQDNDSDLKDHLCERKFVYKISDQLSFNGLIDKVAYKDNVVAVIDYKTGGSAKIEDKYMTFGLSLQLPAYMYLLRNDEKFGKEIDYSGFYLQYLVNTDTKYREDKDLNQIKKDSMKLYGYTSNNIERALLNDRSLESGKSDNIATLRLKNDGSFYANSRVMSDEEFESMIRLVDEKVKEAGGMILNGDFVINPKQINKENVSCEYCPYWDICFRRNKDIKVFFTEKEKNDGEVD